MPVDCNGCVYVYVGMTHTCGIHKEMLTKERMNTKRERCDDRRETLWPLQKLPVPAP